MARLKERAPSAKIEFVPLSRDFDYRRALATGEVDLVIGNWLEPPGELHLARLISDDIVCLVASDHPAASGRGGGRGASNDARSLIDAIEIDEGLHEGLALHPSFGPRAVLGDGKVEGFEVVRCLSVFDSERRFHPQFDDAVRETIPCDTVIFAIGQQAQLNFLRPEDGVELTDRGLIKVDPDTLQTTRPDVFAGGDVVLGPRLFIDAIASGQVAARGIHDYLRRTTTTVALRSRWEPAVYTMAQDWEIAARGLPPSRAPRPDEIATAADRLVEENFPEAEARHQAARCLRCDVQTWFEGNFCIACNGCVDVCPSDCLHLVGLSQVAKDQRLLALAETSLGIDPRELQDCPQEELDAYGGVMLKDETACIRCSMCATRCPTHAFTMRRFVFHRELEVVAGANPRLRT